MSFNVVTAILLLPGAMKLYAGYAQTCNRKSESNSRRSHYSACNTSMSVPVQLLIMVQPLHAIVWALPLRERWKNLLR